MVSSNRSSEFSGPDLSDDDMGPGLNLETPEEIRRIELDAIQGDVPTGGDDAATTDATAPDAAAPDAAAPDAAAPEQTTQKRKLREFITSDVWKHFKRGLSKPDGSYDATCNYCERTYTMGNQRSTSSLRHHILRGCKQIPSSKRHKPDTLQRMLQAGSATENGMEFGDPLWPTDFDALDDGVGAGAESGVCQ